MHGQFTRELRLEDAAKVAGLAPASFSRFFRAATNKRFIEYLGELRIEEACRRLAGGEERIVTIGLECGYANLSNFNRQFLQRRGMTPRAYRVQWAGLMA